MTPDEHRQKAEELLEKADEQIMGITFRTLYSHLAIAHALLAQQPPVYVVSGNGMTQEHVDELSNFLQRNQ